MNSQWKIVEPCFSSREIPKFETLFSLGNGYLGIRGALEEHTPVYKPGTFINGFYETEPIVYGERAYGYPELRQQMIPVTEAGRIRIFLGDHPLDLETGAVRSAAAHETAGSPTSVPHSTPSPNPPDTPRLFEKPKAT